MTRSERSKREEAGAYQPGFDEACLWGFDGTLRGADGREVGEEVSYFELYERKAAILDDAIASGFLDEETVTELLRIRFGDYAAAERRYLTEGEQA